MHDGGKGWGWVCSVRLGSAASRTVHLDLRRAAAGVQLQRSGIAKPKHPTTARPADHQTHHLAAPILSLHLRPRDRLNGGIHPRHHQMAPPSISTK